MKTLKTIIAALICMLALNVNAQTADEVIAKYVAAMGGAEKLNAINTVKMEGSINAQGMDIPITITTLNKKGMRMDIDVMGTTGYQVMNTTKAWRFFPFNGDTDPVEMTETEFKSGKEQMDLTDKLLHAKELGYKIEYAGKEEVDGAPAFKLKVINPAGEESFTFIDEKTSFKVKQVSKRDIGGTLTEIISSFKDFKQTAEGFWFPHTIDSNIQGAVSFSKITANAAVDESIFKP
ncbi:MAG TPA: hypothetical protein PK504_05660 [Ferruginibacter sp.]|nr:hypothetical protein [Ferruginibacter sp.]HRE64036.1 hypothetical protein [Ferruginibacter sp.]